MDDDNSKDTAKNERLKSQLNEMIQEHEALDAAITALGENQLLDQLKMARLKKRKLFLKEEILRLDDMVTPDIIA